MFLLYLIFAGYLLNVVFFLLPGIILENEKKKTTNIQALSFEIVVMSLITAYFLGWI